MIPSVKSSSVSAAPARVTALTDASGWAVTAVSVSVVTSMATDAVYTVSSGSKSSSSATAAPLPDSARPLSVASVEAVCDSWTVTRSPAASSGKPAGAGQTYPPTNRGQY